MMTLGQIAAEINADPQVETRSLDISQAMGKPEKTVVFHFRLPDVPTMWQRNEDAEVIRKSNPRLPISLCRTLALMALCHVSPSVGDGEAAKGVLYQSFVKNREVWSRLETGFVDLFPEIFPKEPKAENETKNN